MLERREQKRECEANGSRGQVIDQHGFAAIGVDVLLREVEPWDQHHRRRYEGGTQPQRLLLQNSEFSS